MFKNRFKKAIALYLLMSSLAVPAQAMGHLNKNVTQLSLNEKELNKKVDDALETLCSVQINNFKLSTIDEGICPQCGNKMTRQNNGSYSCNGDKDWKSNEIKIYDTAITEQYKDQTQIPILYPYGHHDTVNFDANFLHRLKTLDLDKIQNTTLKNKILVIRGLLNIGDNMRNGILWMISCKRNIEKWIKTAMVRPISCNFGALFAYFQLLVKKFYDDRCEKLKNAGSTGTYEPFRHRMATNKFFPKQYTNEHELLARNTYIVYALIETLFGKESKEYKLLECYEQLYSQRFYELVLSYLGKWFLCNDGVEWNPRYKYDIPNDYNGAFMKKTITGITIHSILNENNYRFALENYANIKGELEKLHLIDIGIQFPKHTKFERHTDFKRLQEDKSKFCMQ